MPAPANAQATLGDQVAVFIDLENLALGAGENLPGQADPIPYRALELLTRDYGNASIRRAYADWSKPEFGRHQQNLAQNGITLIQVTRFGAQQKNAVDILMAVDAMEVLITHPDVGTFVLVAGDGDYSPLVQRLREFGKWVVGVGTKASTSSRLVAVCSEYKYWGTIVAAVNPAVRAEVDAKFDIADVERLVVTAMDEAPDDTATGSWLKSRMLSLDPSFDEHNYGARSFRSLLSRLPDVIQVKKSRSSPDMRVTLVRGTGQSDTEAGGKTEATADATTDGKATPARRRRSAPKQAVTQTGGAADATTEAKAAPARRRRTTPKQAVNQ
jgi:uncharacterized LabA/DUF88 family protein